jgi:hypothetical protein
LHSKKILYNDSFEPVDKVNSTDNLAVVHAKVEKIEQNIEGMANNLATLVKHLLQSTSASSSYPPKKFPQVHSTPTTPQVPQAFFSGN